MDIKISKKVISFLLILVFSFLTIIFYSPQKVSAAGEFITTWKTDNTGTSNSTSITIPTYLGETYIYDVDWNNDGTFDQFGITGDVTHDFGTAGTYTIQIRGTFPRIYFANDGDKNKIISIDQWGTNSWSSMEWAFFGCTNLSIGANDNPDLSNLTSMGSMFHSVSSFNHDISDWDMSNVTFVSYMLANTSFNQDIGNWDTSNFTHISGLFNGTPFNQDISSWDVSNVVEMRGVFSNATSFNQNIGNWNVINVTDMAQMFSTATSFNQDIGNWNTSNVTYMHNMFSGATSFNQDIRNWDTSNVTRMDGMFFMATSFNQEISNWDVSAVTNMSFMFLGVTLSTSNYDGILDGWSNQILQSSVSFHAGNSKYCNSGTQRQSIIDDYTWNITDGGYECPPDTTSFITTWKTDNPGVSNSTSITIPTYLGETYNYDVDWNNDGTFDEFGITGDVTHDFGVAGTYTIRIQGDFPRIFFYDNGDTDKIILVNQWGSIVWTSMEFAFAGCSNLAIPATDVPNLSNVSSLYAMFLEATSANPDVSNWDVSNVTNMAGMFFRATSADPNVSNWDVSNVIHMQQLFYEATSADPDVSNWDVSNVISMTSMFLGATSANPDVLNWDVFNVENMEGMFNSATSADPDVSNWNVSSVTDMNNMFYEATSADPDVSNWDVSNVTNMSGMFGFATSANPDTSNWDVSNVTNMPWMFRSANLSNPNTSNWNVSNVENMNGMFSGATSASPDTSNWDVSSVTDMSWVFFQATSANPVVSNWDVSSVTDMTGMFWGATSANPDVSSWDVSNVLIMNAMFAGASSSNPNVSNWNVSNVTNMNIMFQGVILSTSNYDAILNGWSTQILQPNVSFHGGYSKYCNSGTQRQSIIDNYTWSITDEGLDTGCPFTSTTFPSLTTDGATSITQTTATLNGTIVSTGGENSNVRGFEYWIEGGSIETIIENGDFATGGYSASISSLTCGTTYNFRSYATNSIGTGYGEELIFMTSDCNTGGEIITDLEIIKIGNDEFSNFNLLNLNTITENGDYIVFASLNNNDNESIIYLYNKKDNSIERISEIPGEGISKDTMAVISDNGNYVAIISGGMSEEESHILLYDKSSGLTKLVATKVDIPILPTILMSGSVSISNYGDIVISPNFYTTMSELLILIKKGELPGGFTLSSVYYYNNNNNGDISIIDQINEVNLTSPYAASISQDGQIIIYSNSKVILNPDPELEPTIINNYLVYNILSQETEEINIDLNINTSIFLGSSISNDGRYLSFFTLELFSEQGPTGESSLLVIYDRQLDEIKTFSIFDFLTNTPLLESDGALFFNSTDISDDGRYAIFSFSSFVKTLGEEDGSTYPLFIYDKINNQSLILDDGNSYMSASLSGDGKYITFSSPDQLTDDDTDDLFDIFLTLNPLYQEEEEESQPHHSRGRSTGSSAGLIAQFEQQQRERAIAVGIIDYVSDLCLNVPALQTEIPNGWVTNDKYECFFKTLPPQVIEEPIIIPEEVSVVTPVPPQVQADPIVEEIVMEEPVIEEIVTEEAPIILDQENQEDETNFFNWLGLVLGDSYQNFMDFIRNDVYGVFDSLFKDSIGKVLTTVIATIGVTLGFYFGLIKTLFLNPISLSEIPMIPIRLWNLMMIAFGFKKKTRPWGTVYDSTTKQPLDPVYVTVLDLNGNEVATCITDLDGRYGFLLPPGIYQIKAGKNNYQFPSNKLQGETSDIIYQDLYFGGNIEVKEGEVVTKNIPMDSLKFDWNEFAKRDKKLMKFFSKRDLWITRISDYLFNIGLILSIFMIFISPSVYNNIVFVIYIILLVLKNTILKPKIFGQVTNSYGAPLSFSILRFFRSGSDNEVIHKVTDQNGKYYCLVPNGSYYAKIENKNMDESYSPIFTSEKIEVKRGYIDIKFKI